jgi:hypothetical protein
MFKPSVLLTFFLLGTLGATGAETGGPTESDLWGVWELVRVDKVKRHDIPPYGYFNILIEFSKGGTVTHWLPGRESAAQENPYSVSNGNLVGWLGLSNDFDTPRPITVFAKEWLEINLPDGFTATFRRVSDGREVPSTPSCVFFTIDDAEYDQAYVSKIKSIMMTFAPSEVPDSLIGTWTVQSPPEAEYHTLVVLTISDSTASFVRTSLDFPDIGAEEQKGLLIVDGEYLISPAVFCGGVTRFSVDKATLSLAPDGENTIEFKRQFKE